jgi:hypothetical protein
MATALQPKPTHEFHNAPWVILAAAILIPLIATIAVLYFGYPK